MIKGNLQQDKHLNSANPKPFTENLYTYIIIFALTVFVIYLSYSLYSKFAVRMVKEAEINKSSEGTIQLEVLNGCGLAGTADKITDYMRQHHFDVVQMGNYISFDVEKSIVIDRTGNIANAYRVADSLGVNRKYVIQQISGKYFLDVSFIIGKDFNSLKPYK